jgi:hypothetical protein
VREESEEGEFTYSSDRGTEAAAPGDKGGDKKRRQRRRRVKPDAIALRAKDGTGAEGDAAEEGSEGEAAE